MSNVCLSVKNVSKIYSSDLLKKSVKAVDDLSFNVREGECTGFLGHNGAGKTTTIKMILGLTKENSGKVLFKNSPIDKETKSKIGYMAEINKLPQHLSCYEALKYHCMLFGLKNEKELIELKLREVQLWEHKSKKLKDLSKGMGRRISWAMATVHSPELLILDEPFSGLDPKGRILIEKLINKQKSQGISILLCTHEIDAISRICDNFYIINKGKLVFDSQDDKNTHVPKYDLTISRDSDWLEEYKTKKKLAHWDLIETDSKNNTDIAFSQEEDCRAWFNALIEDKYLRDIISYQKSSDHLKQLLLQYFN